MIENIYNDDSTQMAQGRPLLFKMPKNIRQIGQGDEPKRIYVEDYVMTYLKQLSVQAGSEYRVAVLLGQFITIDKIRNIFISGAVEAIGMKLDDSSSFSNDVWTSVYENIKEFFNDVEIVGWCVLRAGLPLEPQDRMRKIHLDNFAGQDKVLLLYECLEKEEMFYIYESGRLQKQNGYYIYYEKNKDMQSYMIAKKGTERKEENYEDKAVKEIRKVIESKKKKTGFRVPKAAVYLTGTMAAAVALVWATALLSGYEKIEKIENTLSVISNNLSEEPAASQMPTESPAPVTNIEIAPGSITTIKEEEIVGDDIVREAADKKEEAHDGVTDGFEAESSGESNNEMEKKEPEKAEATKNNVKNENPKGTSGDENTDQTESNETGENQPQETIVHPGEYYVIEKGDTLESICLTVYQNLDKMEEVQVQNEIEDPDMIIAGQKILLPQ